MPAIIYDFKAIGAKLRKQRIDDWWQPAMLCSPPLLKSSRVNESGFEPLMLRHFLCLAFGNGIHVSEDD